MITVKKYLACGASALILACSGGGGTEPVTPPPPPPPPPPPAPAPVASVAVTLPRSSLAAGEKVQATATTYDGSGVQLTGRTLTWSSSNISVATVANDGMVTSIAAGSVSISAASEGKSGSAGLTVVAVSPEPVASLRLSYTSATIAKGQPLTIVVTPLDATGKELTGKAITWNSTNPSVANANAFGEVSASSAGTATLTATSEGRSANVAITVITFTSIQPGPIATCAIATGGQLYCAGQGYGSLAVPVGLPLRFTSLTSHGEPPNSERSRFCGITIDQDAYCWGANNEGELGTGDTESSKTPKLVAGGHKFKQITAGRYHTCALTTTGSTYCWGQGTRGQLGNGGTASSSVPVPIGGLTVFETISAGKDHTCGLNASGDVFCWGSNNLGELGIGGTQDLAAFPNIISGNVAFATISAKLNTTCGLNEAGAAYCWGDNTILQLGANATSTCDNGKPCARQPVAVVTSLRFSTIAASQFAMCAATQAKQVYCWGGDTQNMFGSQTPPGTCGVPGFNFGCTLQPTPGPSGFAEVTGGHRNYCGIRDDGIAYCWGGNDLGQLGFPGVAMSSIPRPFGVAPDY